MTKKINLKEIKHGEYNINELLKLFDKYLIKTAISVAGFADEDLLQDLKQEGSVGLWQAHERFDPSKGDNYHQWLIYGIKQMMLNYVTRNSRTVRIPSNVVFSKEEVDEDKMPYLTNRISIDLPISDDGSKLSDLMADISVGEDDIYNFEKERIEKLLLTLKPKDIRILELYYYSGYSIYEIGQLLHCTPQNCNDRINRCIRYLQQAMGVEVRKVVKSKRNYRDIQPK